jgi:hypothetical protein
MRPLKQRRTAGYVKRFGQSVELRLIREVPRHESEDDINYNFHLKAAEALDIARKKTYVEDGGLNKLSPLIQAMGHPMLEAEMGKIGGRIGGRIGGPIAIRKISRDAKVRGGRKSGLIQGRRNAESGHMRALGLSGIGARIGGKISGPVLGRKNVESGHLAYISKKGGQVAGRKAAKSGQLARTASKGGCISTCKRWNIDRGKPCICGKHFKAEA